MGMDPREGTTMTTTEIDQPRYGTAFDYAFYTRTCGCNSKPDPENWTCDTCEPQLDTAHRLDDQPDRTDPGYWKDNR